MDKTLKNLKRFKDFAPKDKWLMLIALIACGLLLVSLSGAKTANDKDAKRELERSIEELLNNVTGVGEAKVLLTLKSIEDGEAYEVCGVAVVASGAQDVNVEARIVSAVKTLLGISANKITVLPKKNN